MEKYNSCDCTKNTEHSHADCDKYQEMCYITPGLRKVFVGCGTTYTFKNPGLTFWTIRAMIVDK